MKKLLLSALALFILIFSINIQAALLSASNLSIDPGDFISNSVQPSSGSWVTMEMGGPGLWSYSAIEGINGINLGTIQQSDTIPSGNIDIWEFFGGSAAHQTSSPITILSDDNSGNVTLDFSGWNFIQPTILGHGSTPAEIGFNGSNTIANMTCSNNCSNGESYTLDLTSSIPLWFYDLGNTSPLPYQLHLEGTISSVPLPASFWLFSSGLLGLISLLRTKI